MKSKGENFGQLQKRALAGILAEPLPERRRMAAPIQLALWSLISIFAMAFAAYSMGLQDLGPAAPGHFGHMAFLALAVLGAALAAWEAVSSSIPGRFTGKVYKTALFLAIAGLPMLAFKSGDENEISSAALAGGLSACFVQVLTLGLLPWMALGWMLSKNASFNPYWTGAWSGLAAFLMGAIAVTLHCPYWEPGHMIMSHLLPVALAAGFCSYLGARWFSRWSR